MSIPVVCASCRTSFAVKEKYAGHRRACPKCGTVIDVPGPANRSSASSQTVPQGKSRDGSKSYRPNAAPSAPIKPSNAPKPPKRPAQHPQRGSADAGRPQSPPPRQPQQPSLWDEELNDDLFGSTISLADYERDTDPLAADAFAATSPAIRFGSQPKIQGVTITQGLNVFILGGALGLILCFLGLATVFPVATLSIATLPCAMASLAFMVTAIVKMFQNDQTTLGVLCILLGCLGGALIILIITFFNARRWRIPWLPYAWLGSIVVGICCWGGVIMIAMSRSPELLKERQAVSPAPAVTSEEARYEEAVQSWIDIHNQIADQLAKVHDRQSADAAAFDIQALTVRLQTIVPTFREMPLRAPELDRRLGQKYRGQTQAAQQRVLNEITRIRQLGDVGLSLRMALESMARVNLQLAAETVE